MEREPAPSELMTAILDVKEFVLDGFMRSEKRMDAMELRLDGRIDRLGDQMNRRFDSVDLRIDAFGRP